MHENLYIRPSYLLSVRRFMRAVDNGQLHHEIEAVVVEMQGLLEKAGLHTEIEDYSTGAYPPSDLIYVNTSYRLDRSLEQMDFDTLLQMEGVRMTDPDYINVELRAERKFMGVDIRCDVQLKAKLPEAYKQTLIGLGKLVWNPPVMSKMHLGLAC